MPSPETVTRGEPPDRAGELEWRVVSKLIPVAVSGGAGSRLWPLSTDAEPKQFHPLGSEMSLLQDTVTRLDGAGGGLVFHPPMVVCNARHEASVREQLLAVGHAESFIVLEPFGRNTAPVAMTASILAEQIDPDALVLLMPADHIIAHPQTFAAAVAAAAPHAHDRFVLFGIAPESPETGYGYIEAGEALQGPLREVVRFVEKPDLATAKGYLASGRYLWNAGIFLFSPRMLMAEMERFAPEVAATTRAALAAGSRRGRVVELAADAFRPCPSISIDCAVMEHTDKAAVTPMDAGWADIGSWSSLWEQGPVDDQANLLHGLVEAIDVEGCLVWSETRPVGVIGLRDLVIVETSAGVVVLPKSRAQDIKLLVERLKARSAP